MNERSGQSKKPRSRSPLMEWIFGGIGLVLTLSLIGFIGWQAVTQPPRQPPHIELRVEQVSPVGTGYVAQIAARNHSPETAKGVEIEGTLSRGADEETSSVTFDYVPGGSTVRGGLHFTSNPATGELRLRTLGHTYP